jgi:hypothetical protein
METLVPADKRSNTVDDPVAPSILWAIILKKPIGKVPTFSPTCSWPSNLRATLSRHGLRPRRAALFAERLRGWVLAIVRNNVFDLASQYAHDMDGVADHVSWAPLAFWASWHDAPQK